MFVIRDIETEEDFAGTYDREGEPEFTTYGKVYRDLGEAKQIKAILIRKLKRFEHRDIIVHKLTKEEREFYIFD